MFNYVDVYLNITQYVFSLQHNMYVDLKPSTDLLFLVDVCQLVKNGFYSEKPLYLG